MTVYDLLQERTRVRMRLGDANAQARAAARRVDEGDENPGARTAAIYWRQAVADLTARLADIEEAIREAHR